MLSQVQFHGRDNAKYQNKISKIGIEKKSTRDDDVKRKAWPCLVPKYFTKWTL